MNVQPLKALLIEPGDIGCICTLHPLCSKWCMSELRIRTAVAASTVSALALQSLERFLKLRNLPSWKKKGKHALHFLWSCILARGKEG